MNVSERAERACEALWQLGGASTLAGLSNAAPDALPTVADRTEALGYAERQGWITRTTRRAELTVKGQTRFGPFQVSRDTVSGPPDPNYVPPIKSLESVLTRLPVPHAMFTRLEIDAIIARRHLADKRNQPYPGFMQIGGSGTGKTTTHLLVCRLFGFNPVPCTVNCTQAHTRGALKGIVAPGLGFQPSPYMSLPYLAFEEVDKEEALIKIVDPYFLGEINHATRGRTYQILPVPVILSNPPLKGDRYSLTHPAWRRRSVFMDTQYLTTAEKERIEDFAYWLDQPGNLEPGLLRLEAFTVPERLSESGNAMLQCVRELLSTDFRNRDLYSGIGPLELITLGHIALHGQSHEIAAWHVGFYYLGIASTIPGQVVPDALPMWVKLYDHMGESLSALHGIIKSSKSASELAIRSAEVAKIETPEDLANARMRFRVDKIKALRNVDNCLKLFDPSLFYEDTHYFDTAVQFNDAFTAIRTEVNSAVDPPALDIALKIHNHTSRLAEQYTNALQQELARIEREESEPDNSPEPVYDAVIVDDSVPGTDVAVYEPPVIQPPVIRKPVVINSWSLAAVAANKYAEYTAEVKAHGLCQYPGNHGTLRTKVMGFPPPAARYGYAGMPNSWDEYADPSTAVIVICVNDADETNACVKSMKADIVAQGFPYYVKWELA